MSRWFPVPGYRRPKDGELLCYHKIVDEDGALVRDSLADNLEGLIAECEEHNRSLPGRRHPPTANAKPPADGRAPSTKREGAG